MTLRAAQLLVMVMLAGAAAWAPARQPIKGAMTKPDNRPGLGCGADNAAAVPALQRRARLAGFYDHYLAIDGTRVLEWKLDAPPRTVFDGARHVSVAGRTGYAIDTDDRLLRWPLGNPGAKPDIELEGVALASAGDSSVLAIRCDGSLWQRRAEGGATWQRIAPAAMHAWVGDSSDHYIDAAGQLFAAGRAHRGQYGNGQLTDAAGWVAVAERARFVVAHTGHAVHLRDDGAVLGTGGNRFGPLATHGLGDKADRWGVIFTGASQIATGSRHTLALRDDGALFGWGGADGTTPKLLMRGVTAIAAGLEGSTAIDTEGAIWRWAVGKPPARVVVPR